MNGRAAEGVSTERKVMIDLDAPDARQLEVIWNEMERRHEAQQVDSELRSAIEEKLGSIDATLAETIREELEKAAPAVVLDHHWRELIPNRPTIGFYKRLQEKRVDAWYREDPRRLAGVVEEVGWLCSAERAARAALQVADRAGIAFSVAEPVIIAALTALRRSGRGVG